MRALLLSGFFLCGEMLQIGQHRLAHSARNLILVINSALTTKLIQKMTTNSRNRDTVYWISLYSWADRQGG